MIQIGVPKLVVAGLPGFPEMRRRYTTLPLNSLISMVLPVRIRGL